MRTADTIKTTRARRLRGNSTSAEQRLWNRLRSRLLDGHKFVRQAPIGNFVVDFLCREKRVVIEVDGGQHAESARDIQRDAWLRNHNYRVLRFWNNDVMTNMNGVLEIICGALRVEAPPHPVSGSSGAGDRPLPASGER